MVRLRVPFLHEQQSVSPHRKTAPLSASAARYFPPSHEAHRPVQGQFRPASRPRESTRRPLGCSSTASASLDVLAHGSQLAPVCWTLGGNVPSQPRSCWRDSFVGCSLCARRWLTKRQPRHLWCEPIRSLRRIPKSQGVASLRLDAPGTISRTPRTLHVGRVPSR